jgi:hypothetical protein
MYARDPSRSCPSITSVLMPPIILLTETKSLSFSSWRYVAVSLAERCVLSRGRKASATDRVWGVSARMLPVKLVAEA